MQIACCCQRIDDDIFTRCIIHATDTDSDGPRLISDLCDSTLVFSCPPTNPELFPPIHYSTCLTLIILHRLIVHFRSTSSLRCFYDIFSHRPPPHLFLIHLTPAIMSALCIDEQLILIIFSKFNFHSETNTWPRLFSAGLTDKYNRSNARPPIFHLTDKTNVGRPLRTTQFYTM